MNKAFIQNIQMHKIKINQNFYKIDKIIQKKQSLKKFQPTKAMLDSKGKSLQQFNVFKNSDTIGNSVQNSNFYFQNLSQNQRSYSQMNMIQQNSTTMNQNLSKLKNLLSQKKQLNRRNRLQLSPDIKYNVSSSKFDKQNKMTPLKGKIYKQSNGKSRDKSRYKGSNYKEQHNQSLVSQIKMKIKGESPFKANQTNRSVCKDVFPAQNLYLYEDNQINNNKNIQALVRENQQFQTQTIALEVQIKNKNKKIHSLQENLQKIIYLCQKNQQKFHNIILEKDLQIRRQKQRFQAEKQKIKLLMVKSYQNYDIQIDNFVRKIIFRVNKYSSHLENLTKKTLPKANKKIALQKLIFQNQKPYRKSKNRLQQSPSVKGDTFEQLQQRRHQLQKQQFQQQALYQKNKFQQMIFYYQMKYEQLHYNFLDIQRKNDILTQELQFLKEKQGQMMIENQKIQKLNYSIKQLEEQLQNEKKSKSKNKRPAYLRRQVSPLSINTSLLMTPINKKNVQTASMASQAALDDRNLFNKSYLKRNVQQQRIRYQKQKIKQQKQKIRQQKQKISQQKQKIKSKPISKLEQTIPLQKSKNQVANQKLLQENQKFIQKNNQNNDQIIKTDTKIQDAIQKQLSLKNQYTKEKLRQQYFDELQHIKKMLKSVQQHNSAEIQRSSIQFLQKSQLFSEQKRLKTPQKMKQLVKIETIAKKQKKQKQRIQVQLESIERELVYQKQKNKELQNLIQEGQQKIFFNIKQRRSALDKDQQASINNQNEESLILEQEQPFNMTLQTLGKSRINRSDYSSEIQWQNKVRDRLQNTIQRLQALQNKYPVQKVNKSSTKIIYPLEK